MDASIYSLLLQIRILLLAGSGLLLMGALIGSVLKKNSLSDETSSALSEGDDQRSSDAAPKGEKRRAPRVKSNVHLELKRDTGEFDGNVAYLQDLSPRGAGFDSPLLLPKGKRVELKLQSENGRVTHIVGRIVWARQRTRRSSYGVEFHQIISPAA